MKLLGQSEANFAVMMFVNSAFLLDLAKKHICHVQFLFLIDLTIKSSYLNYKLKWFYFYFVRIMFSTNIPHFDLIRQKSSPLWTILVSAWLKLKNLLIWNYKTKWFVSWHKQCFWGSLHECLFLFDMTYTWPPMVPGRFAPNPVRPRVVSPLFPFAPGRFALIY